MTSLVLAQVFHGLFYAPNYVARGLGFFADEGINLTVCYPDAPDEILDVLIDGRADLVLMGPARLYGRSDVTWQHKITCIGQATAQNFFFVVSRRRKQSFAIRDLAGKTLLLFPGTPTPWLCLQYLLKAAAIDPASVQTRRYDTPESAIRAFLAGDGDYIEIPEPYVEVVTSQCKRPLVVPIAKLLGPVPFSVYVGMRRAIDQSPDRFSKFLNAIARAQTWLRQNSSRKVAATLMPFFPEIDASVISRSVARYQRQNQWGYSPAIAVREFEYLKKVLAGETVMAGTSSTGIVDTRFTM